MNNKCCRIFEEQVRLLLSLPNQEEAKTVLYQALIKSYNQFENQNENQIENQNDYAYVSVSVSDSISDSESLSELSKSILNLLSKNITWKNFSNNYGGRREGSGRKNREIEQPNIAPILTPKLATKDEPFKEDFENFWREYPKQRAGSKPKAYTSYCRAIKEKRVSVDKLLDSVKAYALSDEVKRGFAKGCAAWLNDDRFNVEYKTTSTSNWENF